MPSLCVPSLLALTLLALAALAACGPDLPPPPDPDTSAMEPVVGRRIADARAEVLAEPDAARAWGELGMVLHAHELFGDAAACYRVAAQLDPRDERWPYLLGVVLSIEAEDVEAARAAFRRAVELRPAYAPAHLRLGDLLAGADDLEGAERAYRRALELDPELAPAELGLGRTLLRQGRPEAALDHLERAAEALPNSGVALDALGRAYVQVGRADEAREVAAAARGPRGFDTFPDPLMSAVVARQASSALLWPRARQALADGRWEPAEGLLRRIAEVRPGDPAVHRELGLLLLETDRPGEAVEHLRRAVEQGGGTEGEPREGELSAWQLRAHLGRALAAAGRGGEAVRAFEEAAATAAAAGGELPAWAHHEWGLALAGGGRYGEAVERFRAALRREPDNAEGLFHLGLALEGAGRPGEAVEAYRRAMELEPNELIASRLRALGGRR